MESNPFGVRYSPQQGLLLSWSMSNGLVAADVPIRMELWGKSTFYVWGQFAGDSGESAPVWAEPELHLSFFGPADETPGMTCRVEPAGDGAGYRITGRHARATVALDLRLVEGALEAEVRVDNPFGPGAKPLPLCCFEVRFEEMQVGPEATFLTANAYGGRTYGFGRVAELTDPGLPFVHGCIGLALPVLCLHQPRQGAGVELEFMLDGRPQAWIRPGSGPERATLAIRWEPERLLEIGQTHAFGGTARLTPYAGRPVEMIRRWRDTATERYGLAVVPTPEWARHCNIIELHLAPGNHGITRLDDPRYRDVLQYFKDMGFNAIFAVGHNRTGKHILSPFDYDPREEVGGFEAEKRFLDLCHEMGYHVFLWITTVGIDRDAPEVKAHPDWFTQRADGSLFYAWDSGPQTGYVGYAPDGDPLSKGWREWLEKQAVSLVDRGWDGVFVDGCIPRASNQARWAWPGQGRNGVEGQVRALAERLRKQRPGLITFVEDQSLVLQANTEISMGRYTMMTPFFPKAYWDLGMGGGPPAAAPAPPRIPPELARDYLLVRYASLLPGVTSNDILEGYTSEETRPWTVESLLGGNVPKTHCWYLDDPGKFTPVAEAPEPSEEEKGRRRRLRGNEEFRNLLRFCLREAALVRDALLTLSGVAVEGDAAVVGLLRPGPDRCLLTLIQFANRPATVSVRLAEPADVPAVNRRVVGAPQERRWQVRELMRSMVEDAPHPGGMVGAGEALSVTVAAYGFRVLELTRAR